MRSPSAWGRRLFSNLLAYALSQEAACVIDVAIDVKPGSTDNPINLRARGVVPAAIPHDAGLTRSAWTPPASASATRRSRGQRDCTEAHGRSHREDVDGDGDADLPFHFDLRETGIDPGTPKRLHGGTFGGILDRVRRRQAALSAGVGESTSASGWRCRAEVASGA